MRHQVKTPVNHAIANEVVFWINKNNYFMLI